MAGYEFYVNHYLGSAIPETGFSGVATQAQRYLDKLKRIYRVDSSGQEAESMAVCAMAEVLWSRGNREISSASVGGVSVRYDTQKAAVNRELYEKASIYLDIYRGVSQ